MLTKVWGTTASGVRTFASTVLKTRMSTIFMWSLPSFPQQENSPLCTLECNRTSLTLWSRSIRPQKCNGVMKSCPSKKFLPAILPLLEHSHWECRVISTPVFLLMMIHTSHIQCWLQGAAFLALVEQALLDPNELYLNNNGNMILTHQVAIRDEEGTVPAFVAIEFFLEEKEPDATPHHKKCTRKLPVKPGQNMSTDPHSPFKRARPSTPFSTPNPSPS